MRDNMKNNSAKISTLRKISMVAFFLLFVFGNSSYGFRFRIEEIEVGNNGIRVKATFHKKKHRPSPDTTNYDAVAYVFDYHKRNGVQQLVGLNDMQKSQVLKRASDLVTTGKCSPDTTSITQAWEEIIGRRWNEL